MFSRRFVEAYTKRLLIAQRLDVKQRGKKWQVVWAPWWRGPLPW